MSRFKTGADAAKQSASANFARAEFLSMKDKDVVTVRFLTEEDDWITVKQHQFVPTKAAPQGYSGTWPSSMSAVCRKSTDAEDVPFYDECFICDFVQKDGKPFPAGSRTWALAVLREEVTINGQTGWRDVTRTVMRKEGDTEKEVVEPAVVMLNLGWKNFFSIVAGFARVYGTVLDRDYVIQRSGGDKDTTYAIVPRDVIPGHDLRSPGKMDKYADQMDLAGEVERRMSKEFYDRFFDTRVTVTDKPAAQGQSTSTTTTTSTTTEAAPEVTSSQLAAMRDRVLGKGENAGEAPPAAPEAAPTPEPAAASTGPVNFD